MQIIAMFQFSVDHFPREEFLNISKNYTSYLFIYEWIMKLFFDQKHDIFQTSDCMLSNFIGLERRLHKRSKHSTIPSPIQDPSYGPMWWHVT